MSIVTCFYEEIGEEIGGAVKIYETACDEEHSCAQLPKFCQHCGNPVVLAPGCRRCGSTEHTTGWHDADLQKADKSVQLQSINGEQLCDLLLNRGGKS